MGTQPEGMVFPAIFQSLLPRVGFAWTVRVMGPVILILQAMAACALQPRIPPRKVGPIVEWSAFREMPYTLPRHCILSSHVECLHPPVLHLQSCPLQPAFLAVRLDQHPHDPQRHRHSRQDRGFLDRQQIHRPTQSPAGLQSRFFRPHVFMDSHWNGARAVCLFRALWFLLRRGPDPFPDHAASPYSGHAEDGREDGDGVHHHLLCLPDRPAHSRCFDREGRWGLPVPADFRRLHLDGRAFGVDWCEGVAYRTQAQDTNVGKYHDWTVR